jgi:transcriptional regulator with XRE-family HTH domain
MARVSSDFSGAFSEVVKAHRLKRGLSLAGLAERCGLHQTYIGLWERGKRSPNLDTISALSVGLELSVSTLMADTEKLLKSPHRQPPKRIQHSE